MNKRIMTFTLIAALVLVIFLAAIFLLNREGKPAAELYASIPPEIPGEVVSIPFPVEIILDGGLEDWNGLPFYRVERGALPSLDPIENGSFTYSIAADEEYFYITMQMPDKNIIAGQHGIDFWNEDSMEFYINASGDLNAQSYVPGIFQININAADIGNTEPQALTVTGQFSSEQTVQGFVFKTKDGWAFEAAVSLNNLLNPSNGLEIGFQVQINGASTLDRDVKLIWSKAGTSDLSWQNPALFGRAIFFELDHSNLP